MILKLEFFAGKARKHKHTTSNTNTQHTTMEKIKTANKASTSNTRAKSTKIGLKKTERNKVLTDIRSEINHTLVNVLEL
tara:strand:+ start:366 stop:602 length:237 start_codon:yes stop_codon:yes gene_type:complete